ncbi:MAG: RNA-binding protein [Elusimicrobia bacterium]|nr:RNA-binding protein [Candidatus Liberimonas magnetica]
MNIYVANISSDVSEDELHQIFTEFGQVKSAALIRDRDTGQLRGFGFVEMPSQDEAKAAIAALNGKDIKGKALVVNEARPKPERKSGGGGGYGNRGHSGGGWSKNRKSGGGGGYGKW